jgi:hypothetical protein
MFPDDGITNGELAAYYETIRTISSRTLYANALD